MQAKPVKANGPDQWRLPPLREGDHKYQRGHVLLLGGATMTGAAKLAAWAAQRAGAGVVTLAAMRAAWPVYAASMASVITRPLDTIDDWRWILEHRKISAVLLGPGCEPGELAEAFAIAAATRLPMVLDAGALQLLSEKPRLLDKLTGPFAVLPHAGEFEKLARAFGVKQPDALALAQALGGIVVLKGARSTIAAPDGRLLENYAHAPWLATAGSGDVLAGIAAAFAAQPMNLFDAVAAAVWLHGKAAEPLGRGMVPEDLLGEISRQLRALE